MVTEESFSNPGKKARDILMSSIARRRKTSVFGSRRWWQGGCWSSRSHQEAYLRKLYSKKYNTTSAGDSSAQDGPGVDGAMPWKPAMYDIPTSDEHYLDAFLRGGNGSGVLCAPGASPTEKCVDFLNRTDPESGVCRRHFADVELESKDASRDSPLQPGYDSE